MPVGRPRLLSSIAARLRSSNSSPEALVPPRQNFVAIGFPKVGNTWLRMTLGKYVQLVVRSSEPFLLEAGEFETLSSLGSPLVGEFTHRPLEWKDQTADDLTAARLFDVAGDLPVLLLVRHPLDTLVSLYMHNRFMNTADPYRGSLIEMVDDPVLGIEKYLKFYNIWATRLSDTKRVHLWRYESAKENGAAELAAALNFLGVSPKQDDVVAAVAFGSFDNMKAMEVAGNAPTYRSSGFSAFATGDRSNNDAFHVREGRTGSFVEHFEAGDLRRLTQMIDTRLDSRLGYGSARTG